MESHPHLSLKRKKDGLHQADSKASWQQIQGEHKEGCPSSYEESEAISLLFRRNEKNKINREKKAKNLHYLHR